MYTNMQTIIIEKGEKLEAVQEGICNLLDFDSDWNGENGKEYLLEEIEGLDFESNNDYFAKTFLNEVDEPGFEAFFKQYFERNNCYEYSISFLEVQEGLVLSLYVRTIE